MVDNTMVLDTSTNTGVVFSPAREISAYEALWEKFKTEAKLAAIFGKYKHLKPTFVAHQEGISDKIVDDSFNRLQSLIRFDQFSALFHKDFDYPQPLRDAKHPLEVLYYRGNLDLLASNSIAIVGARKASEDGKLRAKRIARIAVQNGFTVMSGLAAGIDTAAHTGAIDNGGKTIAVIGTPLNECYPPENRELQERIANQFLLVSHVPFLYYREHDWRVNRRYFPERNKIMSALSLATVIVEASETSGSLIQARAALEQGRTLLILKSCFESGLPWPTKFLDKGAIKIDDENDLIKILDGLKNAR